MTDPEKMHVCPNCGENGIEGWELDPEIDMALCNACNRLVKIIWIRDEDNADGKIIN